VPLENHDPLAVFRWARRHGSLRRPCSLPRFEPRF
jgi:hypothetical protein